MEEQKVSSPQSFIPTMQSTETASNLVDGDEVQGKNLRGNQTEENSEGGNRSAEGWRQRKGDSPHEKGERRLPCREAGGWVPRLLRLPFVHPKGERGG